MKQEKTEEITYIDPEVVEIISEQSSTIVAAGKTAQIETQEQYVAYCEYVQHGKQAIATIEKLLDDPIKKAHAAHKSLTTLRSTLTDPIREKIALADAEATRWWIERERLRLKQEEEAREQSRKEHERLERERQEKIDQQRREQQTKLEDEQLAAARLAADAGEQEIAEEILSQPVVIDESAIVVPEKKAPAPVIIERTAPKVKGRSYREGKWTFEITNKNLIPDEYWIVNEKAIAAVVENLKDATPIAGIRVYQEDPKPITRKK